jgi:TolB-like protein
MKQYILRTWAPWGRGLILALFTQYAYAITFAKIYGVRTSYVAYSVRQTSDSGYIVVGSTDFFSAGSSDVLLIKTDAKGNIQWAKTYGGKVSEGASSVRQTTDGGYIVAGSTTSFGAGERDIFLIKTDANGSIIWAKTYGGASDDWAYSVQQTSDGGYIVAGITNSFGKGELDIFLIKTDAKGNIQWAKTYGGTEDEFAYSVQQTSDGGYIVAGSTRSFGEDGDILLIKTDANGNIQWAKTYGGERSERAYSVQQTSDGGYILAGETWSFGAGWRDIFLIKTDAKGNIIWAKTYGGEVDDGASSVQQTSDGGYIVAGYTLSFGGGWYDIFLIKTDAKGKIQWAKTYGKTDEIHKDIPSVQQTSDGGYIVAGYTRSFGEGGGDAFLIKTNAKGNIGSCSIVQDASPIVNNAPFSVTSQSPAVSSPSFTVNSVSPTVESLNLTVSSPCP